MTTKGEKKYRETKKLFFWSLGITVWSALMIYAGFNWVHNIFMIAIGSVVGPLAALMTLFMGLMVIGVRLELKK